MVFQTTFLLKKTLKRSKEFCKMFPCHKYIFDYEYKKISAYDDVSEIVDKLFNPAMIRDFVTYLIYERMSRSFNVCEDYKLLINDEKDKYIYFDSQIHQIKNVTPVEHLGEAKKILKPDIVYILPNKTIIMDVKNRKKQKNTTNTVKTKYSNIFENSKIVVIYVEEFERGMCILDLANWDDEILKLRLLKYELEFWKICKKKGKILTSVNSKDIAVENLFLRIQHTQLKLEIMENKSAEQHLQLAQLLAKLLPKN